MQNAADTIHYEIRDGVGILTLASPPLNIMTARMMDEISDRLALVRADSELKALAFCATGKAFSAGADIGEHAPEQAARMIESFARLFHLLDRLEIPIVMAVDGAALGAGFELAIMADTLIASRRAKFGQPEIRLGFIPPVGVSRLPALVGPARATEIVCSGRTYSADEMAAMGLVSQVVEPEALAATLEARLDDYRQASPLILRLNVRLLKACRGRSFGESLEQADRVFLEELMVTQDVREGLAAFAEKRKAVWKNR
ncbi:MAG: enoyl-CoA hydratase/isomerase family protein [Candidatus Eisenbacteria bacterium]